MIIFRHPSDIHSFLLLRKNGKVNSGFVPTMGALHNGHMALIARAKQENDLVICSIFINPTQFNDPKDFEKYPVSIERDIFLLEKAGCDVLFLPSVTDIYPKGIAASLHYDLGFLDTILEGKFRPGHFQGVCQVVHRLLEIMIPEKLYLGQKDFQQCMVIGKLIEITGINTTLVICPTQREADGLAMSSRNARLSEAGRQKAPLLFSALKSVIANLQHKEVSHLLNEAKELLTVNDFKVEYLELANAATLAPIEKWDGKVTLVVLIAAFLNEVRLIDNIVMNKDKILTDGIWVD